jgi:Cupin superfamily (DUF985)
VDAAEVWYFYRSAPLELKIGRDIYILILDIDEAQAPQLVVPPGEWQAARSLGAYTLVAARFLRALNSRNSRWRPTVSRRNWHSIAAHTLTISSFCR